MVAGVLAFAASACVAFGSDVPADPITVVRGGLPHEALFDVEFRASEGIAVVTHGAVLKSTDGGLTWEAQEPLAELALNAVAVAGERTIIVGQQGAVFVNGENGGYQTVDSGTAERLLSVAVDERGLAVAVGGFGTVLISQDNGVSWTSAELDWMAFNEEGLEAHLYDVEIAPNGDVFVVGEFGLVLRSSDRGATWEALSSGDASLFALHLGDDGVGFAVGQEGLVLRSSDGGQVWTPVDAGTRANLLDVWASPEGEVVIGQRRRDAAWSDPGTRRSPPVSWWRANRKLRFDPSTCMPLVRWATS
jgi:photosystem II stability/assembly factor-like uncharacterized protein